MKHNLSNWAFEVLPPSHLPQKKFTLDILYGYKRQQPEHLFVPSIGDSLFYHNNQKFSTKDKDNDGSSKAMCAVIYSAPWWHNACFDCSLNGLYLHGEHNQHGGIVWAKFRGLQYSLKFSEMKFRPMDDEW